MFENPVDGYLKKKKRSYIVFCFRFLIKKKENKGTCFNFKKMLKVFQY